MAKSSITVDMNEIRRLERDLGKLKSRAVLRASSRALTRSARGARDRARAKLGDQFTLRNRWTAGAIHNTNAAPLPLHRQFALVGALRPRSASAREPEHYLKIQEEGGTLPHTGPSGRRLTTARGSGEGATAHPRKRVARKRNRPGQVKLAQRIRTSGMSRRQRAVATVKAAQARGEDAVWLRLPGSDKQGIFDVRKPRIRMIHRVYRDRLSVRKRPWLQPAVEHVARTGLHYYRDELRAAIRAEGILRGGK